MLSVAHTLAVDKLVKYLCTSQRCLFLPTLTQDFSISWGIQQAQWLRPIFSYSRIILKPASDRISGEMAMESETETCLHWSCSQRLFLKLGLEFLSRSENWLFRCNETIRQATDIVWLNTARTVGDAFSFWNSSRRFGHFRVSKIRNTECPSYRVPNFVRPLMWQATKMTVAYMWLCVPYGQVIRPLTRQCPRVDGHSIVFINKQDEQT